MSTVWDEEGDVTLEVASRRYARKPATKEKKQKRIPDQVLVADMPEYHLIPNHSLRNTPLNQTTITISAFEEGFTRVNGLLIASIFLSLLALAYWLVIQYVLASTSPINISAAMLAMAIIGALGAALFILMILWYLGDYNRLDGSVVYSMIEPIAFIGAGGLIGLVIFNSVKMDAGSDYLSYDPYQTARFYFVLLFMGVMFSVGIIHTPRLIMSHMNPMRKLKDVIVIELDKDEAQSLKRRREVETLVRDKPARHGK